VPLSSTTTATTTMTTTRTMTTTAAKYQAWKTRDMAKGPELIYEGTQQACQDYCDERNSYLQSAGIPSSVCFWFIKRS
jgi:hypothetical protein